jgi:Fe-S-cluster-containing dehydrogenase component
MNEKGLDRREFLKLGVMGLAAAAVGVAVRPQEETAASLATTPQNGADGRPHRWAMVIDQSKCVGCGQCVLACQAHNDIAPDMQWCRIEEEEPIGDQAVYLPIPCQQCENPPCVGVCPVKANRVRPDGIIAIDYNRCIGCRYCQLACPYGARVFNWQKFAGENPAVPAWGQPEVPRRPRGVVEKCSFCHQRIDRGLAFGLTPGVDQMATPACVVACPRKARLFGDLNDPESPVSQALAQHPSFRLREDLGTEPRVYYLPPLAEEASS